MCLITSTEAESLGRTIRILIDMTVTDVFKASHIPPSSLWPSVSPHSDLPSIFEQRHSQVDRLGWALREGLESRAG